MLPSAEDLVFQIQATNNINVKETAARTYRNSVLDGVAEMVDEELEKTFAGQPYFVMLAKKIRKLKDEP